ncbi:MAG: hypothetical protein WCT01_00895 [Candidatus Shapirobacteria bacterium]
MGRHDYKKILDNDNGFQIPKGPWEPLGGWKRKGVDTNGLVIVPIKPELPQARLIITEENKVKT